MPITKAGIKARVVAMKYTPKAAVNFPQTMPVTLTGAVKRAWSVLFFRSSLKLLIVMMGIIIMPQVNMLPNTCVPIKSEVRFSITI